MGSNCTLTAGFCLAGLQILLRINPFGDEWFFLIVNLSSAHQIISHYLQDIPGLQAESPGFELNSFPWLCLDGVDTFMVVVVVQRVVWGQQDALSAGYRGAAFSYREMQSG